MMKCEAKTEAEMRDVTVPTPENSKELAMYIDELIARKHDYGTCVYAMSLSAVAAFSYVAHKLQVTGFQASCADMDILRRTRHLNGPFMLIDAEKLLYPQYDIRKELDEAISEWQSGLADQAIEKLKDTRNVHPNVVAHWELLASKKS